MHVREILLVTSGLNYKHIAYYPSMGIVKPEVLPTVHNGGWVQKVMGNCAVTVVVALSKRMTGEY